jgi:hypothetical protein
MELLNLQVRTPAKGNDAVLPLRHARLSQRML